MKNKKTSGAATSSHLSKGGQLMHPICKERQERVKEQSIKGKRFKKLLSENATALNWVKK